MAFCEYPCSRRCGCATRPKESETCSGRLLRWLRLPGRLYPSRGRGEGGRSGPMRVRVSLSCRMAPWSVMRCLSVFDDCDQLVKKHLASPVFRLGPKGGSGCEPQAGLSCVLLCGAGGCARCLATLCILWGLLAMGFDWREGSLGGTARIIYQTLGSIQAARRAGSPIREMGGPPTGSAQGRRAGGMPGAPGLVACDLKGSRSGMKCGRLGGHEAVEYSQRLRAPAAC